MKFLLDQDVYVATTRMLRDSNHDVVRVAEIGLARADDEIILARPENSVVFWLRGIEILEPWSSQSIFLVV